MSGNNTCLVMALADSKGELLQKGVRLWPALSGLFGDIAVHLTSTTHEDWRGFLKHHKIPTAEAEPSWNHIGLHRRRSLALGLTHSNRPRLFYADPDHILRWIERNPRELEMVLESANETDCLVVGRSNKSFAASPQRLRETESVVNHIFQLITGENWDLMMAARGFSRKAAQLVVDQSTEDTIGNDVEWPLLIREQQLNLDFIAADGLTYETNTVYAQNSSDTQDTDPQAWMLRVFAAHQHCQAMSKFLTRDSVV